MTEFTFPNIDTSYWKIKDKSWMEVRQAEWDKIEIRWAEGRRKPKKALNIIKRYFLKGTLPDFEKLQDYQSDERHLDLLAFIWCHPSRDVELLRELRDQYVHSPLVLKEDVWIGIGGFLSSGASIATCEWSEEETDDEFKRMYTGENELLFDILIGDLSISELPERGGQWSMNKFNVGYGALQFIGNLMCNKRLNYINQDCLYQYSKFIEYWYLSLSNVSDLQKINRDLKRRKRVYEKALYRIHNFDTEKEGDTVRTKIVNKWRAVLDERSFVPEFEQMWAAVKAGEVEVENPWERT